MPSRRVPVLVHGLTILLVFLGGLTYPLWKNVAAAVLLAAIFLMYASAWRGRTEWLLPVASFLGRPWAQKLTLVLTASVVTLGSIEYVAMLLVRTGVVAVYSPMETQLPAGTEDWRLAHITADNLREPDPLLWWRPKPEPPYNAQRTKGPVVSTEKPASVFRVLCYGDSNTDGPDAAHGPNGCRPCSSTEVQTTSSGRS
jgi:hypothetical protein